MSLLYGFFLLQFLSVLRVFWVVFNFALFDIVRILINIMSRSLIPLALTMLTVLLIIHH